MYETRKADPPTPSYGKYFNMANVPLTIAEDCTKAGIPMSQQDVRRSIQNNNMYQEKECASGA
jgi:hypothetical protein